MGSSQTFKVETAKLMVYSIIAVLGFQLVSSTGPDMLELKKEALSIPNWIDGIPGGKPWVIPERLVKLSKIGEKSYLKLANEIKSSGLSTERTCSILIVMNRLYFDIDPKMSASVPYNCNPYFGGLVKGQNEKTCSSLFLLWPIGVVGNKFQVIGGSDSKGPLPYLFVTKLLLQTKFNSLIIELAIYVF